MSRFGEKCDRLLKFKENSSISDLIPATYPIDVVLAQRWQEVYEGDNNTAEMNLAAYIRWIRPSMLDEVTEVCGPMPWIVRSSGDEDKLDYTNAGAYLSLVCDDPNHFFEVLSQVMLSGRTERALSQSALFERTMEVAASPIPIFIQPLIQSDSCEQPEHLATPYLSRSDVQKVLSIMEKIHSEIDGVPLDCEWVADTECGIVSMTSLTERNGNRISGQLACGFQLFSTQHVQTFNSVHYILPDQELNLWQGSTFQEINISRLYLVQARPAANYRMLQSVYSLTNESRDQLKHGAAAVLLTANEVIVHGKLPSPGKYIKAVTLNDAWNIYITYSTNENKQEFTAVFVEIGSRTEHAGIMFSQIGIPVFRLAPSAIPESFEYVIVDPFTRQCWFYNGRIVEKLVFTERELITLPDQCLVIQSMEDNQDFESGNINAVHDGFKDILDRSYIDEQTRERLVQNSIYPSHRFFMYGTTEWYSPTIYGRMLNAGYLLKHLAPQEANDYLKAQMHSSGLQKDPFLETYPLKFGAESKKGAEAYIYWKLLRMKGLLTDYRNSSSLPLLINRLQTDISSCQPYAGAQRLDRLYDYYQHVQSLPIYNGEEISWLLNQFYRIVAEIEATDLPVLNRLCKDIYLNAGQLCRFMNESFTNRLLLELYNEYSVLNAELFLSYYNLDNLYKFEAFTKVFQELCSEINKYDSLADLNSSLFQIAVELFDHTAKQLLLQLCESHTAALYQGYLKLLMLWLSFIKEFDNQSKVLQTFYAWLKDQQNRQHEHQDFFLEEIHWKTRLQDAMDVDDMRQISIKNPHQLHNVLHQWSLSLAPASTGKLQPAFLKEMVGFANTFSEQENRLLRSQKDFFEIELSMCTHKAGFTFYSNLVLVEFSEPPSVEDEEVGRLIAFTKFIEKFNTWFEKYKFAARYEKVVGTWTCYISIEKQDKGKMSQADFKRIFEIMRFMLDSSYDFSHTSNEMVDGLESRFNDSEWGDIFNKLAEYRVQYDDSKQFVNVHLFALSSILTNICISPTLRDDLLRLYRGGFQVCMSELSNIEPHLSSLECYSEWFSQYEKATFISLLLSAVWPKATTDHLQLVIDKPNVLDLLCKNLFRRKDVSIQVYEIHKGLKDSVKKILVDKMLHYCPHVYIDRTESVEVLAERLVKEGKKFKRAKQYLLHAHAHRIQQELLKVILDDVQYIPYGRGQEQEERIIANMAQHKLRYNILMEVLYSDFPLKG
ncbi:hypothetical protein [Paenibacillus sp. KS-LC4]|uniref:hypothetical protein n=1 Tax=Paenibacillus sp. KS-LC4 TaxID=2979727 RepID=UPI0030CBE656